MKHKLWHQPTLPDLSCFFAEQSKAFLDFLYQLFVCQHFCYLLNFEYLLTFFNIFLKISKFFLY